PRSGSARGCRAPSDPISGVLPRRGVPGGLGAGEAEDVANRSLAGERHISFGVHNVGFGRHLERWTTHGGLPGDRSTGDGVGYGRLATCPVNPRNGAGGRRSV